MPHARINDDLRRFFRRCRRVIFEHVDPNDTHANVRILKRGNDGPLHRTGAINTLASSRRDQGEESDFVFGAVEVIFQRHQ